MTPLNWKRQVKRLYRRAICPPSSPGPKFCVRVKLRPREPESLMASYVGTICANRTDASGIKLQADILERDRFAITQGDQSSASLKCNWFA
jgi:hypothetical protein